MSVLQHFLTDRQFNFITQMAVILRTGPQPTTKLKTGMGGGDCGIPMTVARKYIIFQRDNEHIGICDGSATLNPYDEDELAKRLRSLSAKPASNKPSNPTP